MNEPYMRPDTAIEKSLVFLESLGYSRGLQENQGKESGQ